MVTEVDGLIVMGVSDSRWWVAIVPGLTPPTKEKKSWSKMA